MIYRYAFIAFIGTFSLLFVSAGFNSETTEVAKFNPIPPFSGGPGTGGLGDRTGSPVSSSTCSACHSGGSFNVSVAVDVFDPVLGSSVTSYVPGTDYEITFTVSGNANAYGFQAGALTGSNAAGGVFSQNSANSQIVTIAGRPYLEHDNGPSSTGVFQALWTAPAANSGNVTFYGIGLGVNQNGGTSGDNISAPIAITLTEVVPTTISYPGTPFCANEPNQAPVVTGQTNGDYFSTAGLDIAPTGGVINVAGSTPGTYTVNYVYTNSSGTQTATYDVTINPTYSTSATATICENETLTFGSQTLDSNDAGLNTEVFQAANGCDSTVELTLTVLPTFVATDAVTICAGETYDFHGQILTDADAGLNTAVLQSASGCDSTVNLTLTVETIDNTVSASGSVLTANQTGATYQWVDCDNGNAAITGETNASFTATATGNYAVEVTFNNCTETSACTLVDLSSINELNVSSSVVFPNPVSDVFEIKNLEQFVSIESIVLMDANGRVVMNISTLDASVNIAHLDAGVYFLRIQSEAGKSIISVVKK